MTKMNEALFSFIAASPTAYHTAAHSAEILLEKGYERLSESGEWKLRAGGRYFVTRNASSLIAFRVPAGAFSGFMLAAAHGDSPCFKIKENAELTDSVYVRFSTEKYGGMLCASWMDRPLSVAGRVFVKTERGMEARLVDLGKPCAVIPNLAIHMNRKANEGTAYNPAVDMLPLWSCGGCESFSDALCRAVGAPREAILATDLFVYNPQPGVEWNDCVSAPRLDDLQCAFSALTAFCEADKAESLPVFCLFDNEEVGNVTKQGAASTFLIDTLERLGEAIGLDKNGLRRKFADSFMVSADNAHAMHPNHREYSDPNHTVYMNGGVVVKFNANQKYTSDAFSTAFFRSICERAEVPVQFYANRADLTGGGTLGNTSDTVVSVNTVDIGLAQLAMHSAYETAGAKDTAYMVRALKKFYESAIRTHADGSVEIL